MGKEILTYDDLLQIVELIKSAESFSEFHLKIGDIERAHPSCSEACSPHWRLSLPRAAAVFAMPQRRPCC